VTKTTVPLNPVDRVACEPVMLALSAVVADALRDALAEIEREYRKVRAEKVVA
jgi:hypothetical protein